MLDYLIIFGIGIILGAAFTLWTVVWLIIHNNKKPISKDEWKIM